MYIYFVAVSIVFSSAFGAVLITPYEALAQNFGKESSITKKSILLSKEQALKVSQKAQSKLSTKLYRAFVVTEKEKILGHAVLLNETVRTKNAAVLYLFDSSGRIKTVEIVAFNEPPEYIPSDVWMEQFREKTISDTLRVGKDIPTITGATMSARNIADGSRVALALYEIILKP